MEDSIPEGSLQVTVIGKTSAIVNFGFVGKFPGHLISY